MIQSNLPHATTIRRFAAMVYDFFLVFALWLLTTIPFVALGGGEAVHGLWYQMLLLFEAYLFYAYFWHLKGQTLGMQVWKIRTEKNTGEMLSVQDSIIRFGLATITMAPFGLGFLWMMGDRDRLTIYDRYSHSRVVYLGAKPYPSEQPRQAKATTQSGAKKKSKKRGSKK